MQQGKLFGTDGFRGKFGERLTALHAFEIGRFLGTRLGRTKKVRVCIGKDTRLSSYSLEDALCAGLTCVGADAYILHVTTTACVSFVTRTEGFDCGVMISASHNPFDDNGIKLFNNKGEKTERAFLDELEDYLLSPEKDVPSAVGDGVGRTVDFVMGRNRYCGHLISLVPCSFDGWKVGLDTANGSAFALAPDVFRSLGAQVSVIGDKPNGTNINDGVGSTHPDRLRAIVEREHLDVGFAFDGDADRCITVLPNGRILDGDGELFVAARFLAEEGTIVGTVMSNGGLMRSLPRFRTEICDVGDRCVTERVMRTGAVCGGEPSGHLLFPKLERTGDGIVTALTLMEAAVTQKKSFVQLCEGYAPLPRATADLPLTREMSVSQRDALLSLVPQGYRAVVRPSGTEPLLRLMVEGEDLAVCRRTIDAMCGAGEV